MSRAFVFGLLLATLVALGFRCMDLDRRPMHGDEAVHAIKFRDLWDDGKYKYDPNEYHGPSLYYLTYGWAKLTGAPKFSQINESTLRMVPVLFGVGLVLLLVFVADGLGPSATVWAALLTAISPAMVFYSRYYIHEMLLVFFAFLTIAAGWRYWRGRRLIWAVVGGLGFGLMHATKETFVFSVVAGVGALIANCWWGRRMGENRCFKEIPPAHIFAAVAAWAVVVVVLFSSFFTNSNGIVDSVKTYEPWFKRAGGASPHIHEWHFYFDRLAWFHRLKGPTWSEALILGLAVIGLHRAFTGRGLADSSRAFVRFIGFYTVGLTGIYCVIGYKTPWCLLNFWQGMIVLAGVGAVALIRLVDKKWYRYATVTALLTGMVHLGVESVRANGDYAAAESNPYVYAHTADDLLNLVDTVEGLAKVYPGGHDMVIQTVAPESDYWPLPWYFRKFKNQGFYDELPAPPYGPVMIISAKLQPGGSSLVIADEVTHSIELAKRLTEHSDAVAAFIWEQLPEGQRAAITNSLATTNKVDQLRSSLAASLNFMVSGYSIFDQARFQGVQLRAETEQLAREKPIGDEAARLNRMLLEDAFPTELAKHRVGLTERKTHVSLGMTKLRTKNFLELWVDSKLMERYIARSNNEQK